MILPKTVEQQTALAVANPTINLPVLAGEVDMAEMREVFEANLGETGTTFEFEKIKMPSGGGIAWEIPTEDEKPQVAQELKGVIMDHYLVNAFWEKPFDGDNNPPDCFSLDAMNGHKRDSEAGAINYAGSCLTCNRNQFGSGWKIDPKTQRKVQTKGKACKNIYRIYLLQEGQILPVLIPLPPTSIGNLKDYLKRLTARMKPYYAVTTKIKLEKAISSDGITYSEAVFAKDGDLSKAEALVLKSYIQTMKPVMRAVAIEGSEYDVTNESTGAREAADGAETDDEPY
ncbi:MAG: hypothetical protein ACYDG6_06920 [Thermincolia bacterium]